MGFVGRLEDLGISDIFQILALGKRTGKLTLTRRNEQGLVVFRNGAIVFCQTNAVHETLGSILVGRALADNPGETVTLIGLNVSNLTTEDHRQLELDLGDGDVLRSGSDLALRRSSLEESIDEVREKYGKKLLRYGMYERGMGDDFRRLAEKS